MDLPSMILLGLVLLWALAAIRYVTRHGACGCGAKSGCTGCSGGCKGCHKCK